MVCCARFLRCVHAPEHRALTRRRAIAVNGSSEISSASGIRRNRDIAERRRSEIADADNPSSKARARIDRRLFAAVHLANFRLGIARLNLEGTLHGRSRRQPWQLPPNWRNPRPGMVNARTSGVSGISRNTPAAIRMIILRPVSQNLRMRRQTAPIWADEKRSLTIGSSIMHRLAIGNRERWAAWRR